MAKQEAQLQIADQSAEPLDEKTLSSSAPANAALLPENLKDLVDAISILLKIDRRLNPDKYKSEMSTEDEL